MIIPNVIYKSIYKLFPQEIDSEASKIILKLFVRFLKERKAIVTLYAFFKCKKVTFRMDLRRVNDLVLDLLVFNEKYDPFIKKWTRAEIIKDIQPKLVLAQLWRFYLLDHIEEIPHKEVRKMLVKALRYNIAFSGLRNDEEIKMYFEKYKILNGK